MELEHILIDLLYKISIYTGIDSQKLYSHFTNAHTRGILTSDELLEVEEAIKVIKKSELLDSN